MRASFERSELLRLLGPATKPVEARNTIPVLANILLSVTPSADGITDGTVSITGTDLDIRITTTGAAKVAEPGAVTVDAKRFEDIVRKLPAGAEIAVSTEPNTLIVKAGRSRFKLPTLPVEDFPDITVGEFDATFTADVAALFKPVQYAMSDEQTRYYLCGVYFHVADGKLRAVATTGHVLAQHDGPAAEHFAGIIVPRKVVPLVPPGEVTVSVSASKVRFAAPGIEVVSKVIDGTYPDYQRVIPRGNDKVARVDRAALAAANDRVATVVSERGRAVKLSFTAGAVVLSTRNEANEAQDELAAEYASAPIDIGFQTGYVASTLAAFSGETVEIAMNDPGSPAIFRDGGPLLAIIMPMRV
ncbi:DNA polymerase III subunit beta [Bosea thiooxidans]